jgi:hypothetical protein
VKVRHQGRLSSSRAGVRTDRLRGSVTVDAAAVTDRVAARSAGRRGGRKNRPPAFDNPCGNLYTPVLKGSR